jgi:hypothetical protein
VRIAAHPPVLALALLAAASCGDDGDRDVGGFAHVPQPIELVGSYDLTTTRGGETMPGVAVVERRQGRDLELWLSAAPVVEHPTLVLHGTFRRDGSLALTSDAIPDVHAAAHGELRAGTLRIAGRLEEDELDFVMERPYGGDPRDQSGLYRLRFRPSPQEFHGDSTVDVDLQVDAAGRTRVDTDGAEHRGDGAQISSWSNTIAMIAPSGRVQLQAQYDFVAGGGCFFGAHCRITIVGAVPSGEATEATGGRYAWEIALTNPSPIRSGDVDVVRLSRSSP